MLTFLSRDHANSVTVPVRYRYLNGILHFMKHKTQYEIFGQGTKNFDIKKIIGSPIRETN